MKTGRNLQEVLVELDRQNKAKQDFISPAQGMRLREDGHTFELNHLTTDRQMTFGTTSLFHRQVASALGIPAKYYDLMQSQKPELLAENVNAWFADRTSSYMVRSMDYGSGQVARALLSERYRRIDNMEIATSVLPLFAGNDQYEVMSCEVTENRLYLKVVNHRLEMEVRKGDIVQAGVMISNSEVGLGAVSIQPLVYRLVCTNGMVVNDMGERRHHVGRQAKAVEDSFTLYSDETMEAEDKAFLLKLRDTTMAAIDEARFAQVVGRLQESMAVPITGKVQDVVQLTSQSYGINADEQEGILKYLIAGGVYAADVIVTYQVLPEKSAWLYANVSDTKNLVSDELVASAIKSAMAELGPNEVTNRTKIEPLAQQKLAESLNQKYGEGAVFINKVVINNMDFEEAYNTAIQQKSIAQQNADKQKIENEAAIAKAEADKQVAITNAEAEAQKTSIAADAQAEANRKIAESLSDTLIEYQKIQKWDGKLPTVSGSNALVSIDPAE